MQSAHFQNFFATFDRKLRKNVVKRCLIQPLTQRILTAPKTKFFNQAEESKEPNQDAEEEKTSAEVRPYLLVESLALQADSEQSHQLSQLVAVTESMVTTLIVKREELLTCTLADQLQQAL